MTTNGKLPPIPYLDLRQCFPRKESPITACITPRDEEGTNRAEIRTRDRCKRLLRAARQYYGPWFSPFLSVGMLAGDRVAARWMARQPEPYNRYFAPIRDLSHEMRRPGILALNLSMELTACTSGVFSPDNRQMQLLRALDWEMQGVAENTIIQHEQHEAGEFYNITLPGFAGMLTGHAPGRFSVAINQAPSRAHWLPGKAGNLIGNKRSWTRAEGWCPSHLLRYVFETAEDYGKAVELLSKEKLCTPVIFIIAGPYCNEGLVIERTEDSCFWRAAPDAAANNWSHDFQPQELWCNRRPPSRLRQSFMRSIWQEEMPWREHQWLRPPILNEATQIVVEANPHPDNGYLAVWGLENRRYITLPFLLRRDEVVPTEEVMPDYMTAREIEWRELVAV